MLSIGKIAPGQHRYYQQQVAKGRDDYYSGKGEAPADWIGSAAAKLGLEGTVSPEQFDALIEGVDPSDPALERRLNPRAKQSKVAAYDLTFSAPKSVSVLFATADAVTAADMIAAHESAVQAALEYVEAEAVKVRRGKDGAVVQQGGGLLAAAYRHRMSRAMDPQLHTHVVCANLSESAEDGRWTGMWGTPLYQHAKAAGTLYQAHLRAEISDRLGLEWGTVRKGAAELQAIDKPVLEAFSQRRQRMEELAAAGGPGLGSKAGAEASALGTRDRKTYDVDTVIWREEVQERAAELGLDVHAIDRILMDGRLRLQVGGAVEDLDVAELGNALTGGSGLTLAANSFGTREAIVEVASAHQQGVRVPAALDRVGEVLERSDVHELAPGAQSAHGETRYTTEDLVTVERRLVAKGIRRAAAGVAVVPERTLAAVLAGADRPLNAQQTEAVQGVARSGNGVDVVEALAGTGKTYTAGVLREAFARAGHHVIGTGPTGRAVRELREEAGIPSWTIDSLQFQAQMGGEDLPAGTVIVLDEAGMTSTRKTEWLLDYAERSGAKIVAIGDSGQLPSVDAGGWLTAVGARVGHHELTEVMRQRDARERRVLGLLHDGEPEAYVDWLESRGRMHVHGEPAGALATAIEDWATAVDEHGAKDAVLIARNNETREILNTRARAVMQERGALGAELVYGDTEVAVGDRVIARRNDSLLEVDNGTRGTVREVHADRIVIETDSGAVRELGAAYVDEHVEHAYALTGHGMQGGTVEWAGVVAQPRELTRGWSYTALSRARGETHAYVQAIDALADAERADLAPHDAPAEHTRESILAEVLTRMVVRDDEDLAVDDLYGTEPASDLQLEPAPRPRAPRPGAPPSARTRLARAARERAQLQAARKRLPLRGLERLELAQRQRGQTQVQGEELERRLEELPAPPEARRFRTPPDEHAVQRARLASGIDAAREQLDAIDGQIRSLQADLDVDPGQIRTELDALDAQLRTVELDEAIAIGQLADQEVAERPAWARDELGERPADTRAADVWDAAVRGVARARLAADANATIDGLGDKPDRGPELRAWHEAEADLRRAREVLRRDDVGPAEPDVTP